LVEHRLLTNHSAASAIAGNTLLRSLAGAGFPLFSSYMFNGMGIQWASTLLGCVAAALVPIPVVFYIYGHRIRKRSAFAPTPPPGQHPLAQNQDDEVTLEVDKETENDVAAHGSAPVKDEAAHGNGV
jgi:DHA1 family multidrug resistance protein-like MFS transporter